MSLRGRREVDGLQKDPKTRYSILVTGDHSTPVMFGDHSHEPVPVAIADVRDIVASLGPDRVAEVPLGPLHNMTQHTNVAEEDLVKQAEDQKARRTGVLGGVGEYEQGGDGVMLFDETAAASGTLGRFPSSELIPLILQVLGR